MAYLKSRDELKEYVLRSLGAPVIEINITPEQLEDRVSEAVQQYQNSHMDGSSKAYITVAITQEDIDRRGILIPKNVLSINNVMSLTGAKSQTTDYLFDVGYYMQMSAMASLTQSTNTNIGSNGVSNSNPASQGVMSNYQITMGYFQQIQDMFNNSTSNFIYSRNSDILNLQIDWTNITPGMIVALDVYVVIDPDENLDFYNDSWFKKYCIALVKQQWGRNLMLFSSYQLPGGLVLDGEKIYQQANTELEELYVQLKSQYQAPLGFLVG